MQLALQRQLFEIPDDVSYLNCAQLSPQLRSVRRSGEEAVARRSSPWAMDLPQIMGEVEELRELFARIIGADSEGVALVPTVSYALSTAAKNLGGTEGKEILLLEDQFPANVYPWKDVAQRCGMRLRSIARPADSNWTQAVLRALESRPAIVAIENCHWLDGALIDLKTVAERTHEIGAALVLDVTQSVGACPIDVKVLKPDFLVSSGHKWLLGPYAWSYLYVAPQHRNGSPLEAGYSNREGSGDFAKLLKYNESYLDGARRFDSGAKLNFVMVPMAIAALKQILEWRVERIEKTLRELTGMIAGRANELGLSIPPLEHRVGHLVGLRFDKGIPESLAAKLLAAKVYVAFRGNVVRLSPHLYNTRNDIERFFEVLAKVI